MKDIWKLEPRRNEEIYFQLGNDEIHFGMCLGSEKLRKCDFYSFDEKKIYNCDASVDLDERVTRWSELKE